ncbi:ABC transporter substrate-binding protein [Actinocorallia aurea]
MTAGLSAQGVLADNAATAVLAAKAGAARVNAAGGVAGRQIEITVVDDEGNPTTALTKIREAIAKDKPDAVLNGGPSTVSAATLPVLKQNKILSFNVAATPDSSDPKAYPLNFDLTTAPADYINGLLPYFTEKGYKSAGIIHSSTANGVTFGTAVTEALEAKGITVVDNQEYDVAALDMTPQLQSIQAKKPDVLLMNGYGAPVGYLLKGIEKLGWDVPVVGDGTVAATGLVSTPPPSGILGTSQVKNLSVMVLKSSVKNPDDQLVNDVITSMAAEGEIKATLLVATNYDALPLIAAAAEKVGDADDPEALASALEDPAVLSGAEVAILKKYAFSATSHGANLTADEFAFIAPSEVENGQYR